MEEYVRLFFTGEALQRMFAFVCNSSSRDVQYKISNVITSMLKTTLCIRLTPVGLAPFRNDITMVLPYSMMDRAQLDFLDNITQQVTLNGSSKENMQAMGIGNDVVVVTVLDAMRVWTDSCLDKTPLSHRHSAAAGGAAVDMPASTASGRKRKAQQEVADNLFYRVREVGVCMPINSSNILLVILISPTHIPVDELRKA